MPLPAPLTLFPYTTLFRSGLDRVAFLDGIRVAEEHRTDCLLLEVQGHAANAVGELQQLARESALEAVHLGRSEEHTSELQSRLHLVCRLLLEKKKQEQHIH